MEYKKLTIINLIKGKLGNIFSRFTKKSEIGVEGIEGYKMIKDLTPPYSVGSKKDRVGIYLNKKGEKVVIKKVLFSSENLDSIYLRNEAITLNYLKKFKAKIVPEFVEIKEGKNQVSFITKLFSGQKLEDLDNKIIRKVSEVCIWQLRDLSKKIKNEKVNNLPVREPFYYLISYPLSLVKLIIKDPQNITWYLALSLLFYKNYLRVLYGDYKLGFVHRDIYPDNILFSKKTNEIKITDWESAIISDELYDISMFAMLYTKYFGAEEMSRIINEHIGNEAEKKRFFGLAIFNSIQTLSNNKVNHYVFKQTQDFLKLLTNDISKTIFYKKSPFEIVNLFTLDLINLFYKFTKLSKVNKKKKIVLCYHAVGDGIWRYSVTTENFRKQVDFLSKNYKIVTTDELLKEDKGGINITFDDGYLNVVDNAYPILKSKGLEATMFALGEYKNPNRVELDNSLPIINYDQIRELHKAGWEIGYHTNTHSNLGKINDTRLEEEIVKSKSIFEKKIGLKIKYFAYPKGIYSDKIVSFVKKAGYKAAFTTDGYEVKSSQDTAELSRISIEYPLTGSQFEALLSPIGLFVSGLFTKILMMKAKYLI
ncbi:MAG TPA: polysaccharide deacetylase family protein [Patescibacteria group bacterium]|nr:polysaccharide deacetylase family protein [Patescibacteria group bacterium]